MILHLGNGVESNDYKWRYVRRKRLTKLDFDDEGNTNFFGKTKAVAVLQRSINRCTITIFNNNIK